jgi:hypothetical protein
MTPRITRPTMPPPTISRIVTPETRPAHRTPRPTRNVVGATFAAASLTEPKMASPMTGAASRMITVAMSSRPRTTSRPVSRNAMFGD